MVRENEWRKRCSMRKWLWRPAAGRMGGERSVLRSRSDYFQDTLSHLIHCCLHRGSATFSHVIRMRFYQKRATYPPASDL